MLRVAVAVLPKIDPDTRNEQSLDIIRAVNRSNLTDINTREMSKKGSAPYVQIVAQAFMRHYTLLRTRRST